MTRVQPSPSDFVVRPAAQRGHVQMDWLDTYHTFSFGSYYSPQHMGFRDLRVINEDRVAAAAGFPPHPHRDMEIITYVLAGALQHRDSMGTSSIIRPGEIQRMSAGSGVTHSEMNPSADTPVHLLQIWILPDRQGMAPSYEQKTTLLATQPGVLHLIASPEGGTHAVRLQQDVRLYAGRLTQGQTVTQPLARQRFAWLQVARGQVQVAGMSLRAGDGLAITHGQPLALEGRGGSEDAEVLLFDLK